VFWRLLKTAIFSMVAPGTVGVLVPQLLRDHRSVNLAVPFALHLLGLLLLTCGVAIYLWCAWDFAAKGLGTPSPIDAPKVLVIRGLYRFTRNPMYVGVSAMILGQALFYESLAIAIYLCAVITAFHLFVRLYEEPTLTRLFGAQYQEYRRNVPRWLV